MIVKRQFITPMPSDTPTSQKDRMWWWYSPTAYIIKWTIVTTLFVGFFLWITLGYYHARRRIRRGLRPMAYHRWLVPRSQRGGPFQNNAAYYQPQPGAYGMQGYREPPPVYTTELPPSYQPPGGSKAASQQPYYGQGQVGQPAQHQQTGVV